MGMDQPNGQAPRFWTFKTLRLGQDQLAVWHTMSFKFPIIAGAAMAAQAYMLAHAERGEMVVVSLEPCEELKPTMDRLVEHDIMLTELKRQFTENGISYLWDLVHSIDPEWPNPWRDPDGYGEGDCLCKIGMQGPELNPACPVHGEKEE